jgi:hypothetical protein
VAGVAGALDGTLLTTSRPFFERGLPGEEGRLHFASFGDPVFEAVLTQVESLPLPGCVRRLAVQVEGYPAEVVGYAVAVRGNDGARGVEVITSWRQLQDFVLAEDMELTEMDIEPLKTLLAERIRREITPGIVRRIEQTNLRAGHAQLLLDYAITLYQTRNYSQEAENPDSSRSVLEHIQETISGERKMNVSSLPPDWMAAAHGSLLFEVQVPQAGGDAWLHAPWMLLQSAVDAAWRVADRARRRRGELGTEQLLRRLRAAAEREFREIGGVRI